MSVYIKTNLASYMEQNKFTCTMPCFYATYCQKNGKMAKLKNQCPNSDFGAVFTNNFYD